MNTKNKAILFNDIKGSSKLWKEYDDKIMHNIIIKCINIVKKLQKNIMVLLLNLLEIHF